MQRVLSVTQVRSSAGWLWLLSTNAASLADVLTFADANLPISEGTPYADEAVVEQPVDEAVNGLEESLVNTVAQWTVFANDTVVLVRAHLVSQY